MPIKTLPGSPYPQGATWDGTGVNFAIYSENATGVDLCLFDGLDSGEHETIAMQESTSYVWHCFVPGLTIGQLYGYRVHGPYEPKEGLRFNPAKLLIDPYAKAIAGKVNWDYPVFGYRLGDAEEDLSCDSNDDAAGVPKGVVTTSHFDWQNDRSPDTHLHDSIIYELHVKGFTVEHPEVPENLRGTYLGLVSPPILDYFKKLGVTAIELMPTHSFLDDKILLDKGLQNYWGYNTTNFFSPESRYSSSGDRGQQIGEFKTMVRELHRANIEVVLDVVYNHTSEGNQMGPTLSFRGVDNPTYYRLLEDNPRYYMDYTGTGNTLNVRHPQVLKLVMDSLRYWVLEMHVDGFRFDLAAALARELHDVDRLSAFFDVINQDPVISKVKLIAEPWDVGEGGYQVGHFPALWAEWNGKYRDVVRRYWKGDDGQLHELGYRLTGSSDLYKRDGRRPSASINFVTAHDGFTLQDLVTYDQKHNEANGEGNQDGTNANYSWNCGVEGPSDDPRIIELRDRQKRNMLTTLLLSQGVPMILAGDELGRTQRGNNNAYAQDNEISWVNWNPDDRKKALAEFAINLIQLRKNHPNFHRRKFFQDSDISPTAEERHLDGLDVQDVGWYRPDGQRMTEDEWKAGWVRCLGMRLSGRTLDDVDQYGEPIIDDSFLLCLNPHHEHIRFYLPACTGACNWEVLIDTRDPARTERRSIKQGEPYDMIEHSAVLFCETEVKR
ncbi:MAG: glycogen debranching protein GlgX [Acidobacteriaceae bacterium]|nr:glycogen debranching protein GlgX [Acidobacteriaceae bacterium]MBV9778806.1 glycogen debranching protein GlgX [Acidobacteriaceae bacterium]